MSHAWHQELQAVVGYLQRGGREIELAFKAVFKVCAIGQDRGETVQIIQVFVAPAVLMDIDFLCYNTGSPEGEDSLPSKSQWPYRVGTRWPYQVQTRQPSS